MPSDMKTWEFWVKPGNVPASQAAPIKIQVVARNIIEARAQAEAIYGKGCDRSPIIVKK